MSKINLRLGLTDIYVDVDYDAKANSISYKGHVFSIQETPGMTKAREFLAIDGINVCRVIPSIQTLKSGKKVCSLSVFPSKVFNIDGNTRRMSYLPSDVQSILGHLVENMPEDRVFTFEYRPSASTKIGNAAKTTVKGKGKADIPEISAE